MSRLFLKPTVYFFALSILFITACQEFPNPIQQAPPIDEDVVVAAVVATMTARTPEPEATTVPEILPTATEFTGRSVCKQLAGTTRGDLQTNQPFRGAHFCV